MLVDMTLASGRRVLTEPADELRGHRGVDRGDGHPDAPLRIQAYPVRAYHEVLWVAGIIAVEGRLEVRPDALVAEAAVLGDIKGREAAGEGLRDNVRLSIRGQDGAVGEDALRARLHRQRPVRLDQRDVSGPRCIWIGKVELDILSQPGAPLAVSRAHKAKPWQREEQARTT